MHEASEHQANAFVTLTYAEEALPPLGSLRKTDFQKFMKRLRKWSPEKVRFYGCGEYGPSTCRPHYHALLFGCDFTDKVPYTVRSGHPVYHSETLERLWPYGRSEIGSVTFESAAYVARYMLKKHKGSDDSKRDYYASVDRATGEVEGYREPEFALMSRRPGIGRDWIEKYGTEVYRNDSVIVNGKEVRPPKYYDCAHELVSAEEVLQAKRRRKAMLTEESTDERKLTVKETIQKSFLNLKKAGAL